MRLLNGETVAVKSPSGVVMVTNQRVVLEYQFTGDSGLTSIPLESLDSCQFSRTSKPILLILSIVAFALTLFVAVGMEYQSSVRVGIVPFAAGVVLLILYFRSRQTLLRILSARSEIELAGFTHETASEFILMIDWAKTSRTAVLAARAVESATD